MQSGSPVDPFTWIDALAKGGPWAIVVGLVIACIYLWRAYVQVRDENEKKIDKVHTKVIELVEGQIANNTELKGVLEANTKAVENFDRRLENVEKAVQK